MTIPVKAPTGGDIMEQVLLKGDLAKLSPDERVRYYNEVCRSMGLNPLTTPFSYITLQGKLQLYALRSCTDQLRKIHNVTVEIVSRDVTDGILTVHVRAKTPEGRADEDLGAVSYPDTLRGELRANAELKAVTKAKRRATLSICGLGWLDETEAEDIPGARPAPVAKPNVMVPPHDAETGEIIDEPLPRPHTRADAVAEGAPDQDTAPGAPEATPMSLKDEAREAAKRGEEVFKAFHKRLRPAEKSVLGTIGDELRALMNEAAKAGPDHD